MTKKNRTGNKIKADQWPLWIFSLMALLLPIVYSHSVIAVFNMPKVTVLRLGAPAALLLLLIAAFRNGKLDLPRGFVVYLCLAFFIAVTIATIFSVHFWTSLVGIYGRYLGLWTYINLLILFFASWSFKWNQKSFKIFFTANLIAGLIVALTTAAQYLGSSFLLTANYYYGHRGSGTMGNPDFTGVYLLIALGFALTLFYLLDNHIHRLMVLAAGLIILLGLAATISIGALGAAVIMIITYFIIYYRLWRLAGENLLISVIIATILITALGFGVARGLQMKQKSLSSRRLIWSAGWSLSLKHPLLGIGPDTMHFMADNEIPLQKGRHIEIAEDAHNIFLTLAATAGWPALLLFIFILTLAVRSGIGANHDNRAVGAGMSALIIGYLAAEMLSPDSVVAAPLFWLALGILFKLKYGTKEVRLDKNIGFVLVGGASLLLLILSWFALSHFMADYYYLRAEKALYFSQAEINYRLAARANPVYDIFDIRMAERLTDLAKRGDRRATNSSIFYAKRAIEKSPLNDVNYVDLGDIYEILGDITHEAKYYNSAVANYKQALKVNKYQKFAAQKLYFTYESLHEYEQAARWQKYYKFLVGRD